MPRVVVPGIAHHVRQRGNRGQRTFFRKDDYQAYVELMAEWCRRCGVGVRMKRSGMRWSRKGSPTTLSRRVAGLNGPWDALRAKRPLGA